MWKSATCIATKKRTEVRAFKTGNRGTPLAGTGFLGSVMFAILSMIVRSRRSWSVRQMRSYAVDGRGLCGGDEDEVVDIGPASVEVPGIGVFGAQRGEAAERWSFR